MDAEMKALNKKLSFLIFKCLSTLNSYNFVKKNHTINFKGLL